MKENKELIFDIFEKVNGKSDLDWSEIRENHGLDCHPDTLRKAAVGIKMAADAGVLNFEKGVYKKYENTLKKTIAKKKTDI